MNDNAANSVGKPLASNGGRRANLHGSRRHGALRFVGQHLFAASGALGRVTSGLHDARATKAMTAHLQAGNLTGHEAKTNDALGSVGFRDILKPIVRTVGLVELVGRRVLEQRSMCTATSSALDSWAADSLAAMPGNIGQIPVRCAVLPDCQRAGPLEKTPAMYR